MTQSHQTFRLIPTVKLLGIMFINRCWSTTFHTITVGDVDGCSVINPSEITLLSYIYSYSYVTLVCFIIGGAYRLPSIFAISNGGKLRATSHTSQEP
jgi:hypothetical protein